MFNLFGKKIQTKEQGWVKLPRRQWPKWITKGFPRRESGRCIFRGKTFDYRIYTKVIMTGTQGRHDGIEDIDKMWRRLR
jgi:hypothetical protein